MQAGQELSDSFAGSWFTMERSGYLDEVAIWAARSEMLDLRSEEKLTKYSIFVFEHLYLNL